MFTCFNKLTFWYLICQLSYRREKRWLISSLKVLELLSIEEGNEIWDGVDLESLSSILRLLSVDSCEHQILIIIRLGSSLESWLDAHAWRASWGPEIDNETW
jgi:hypothetical protein